MLLFLNRLSVRNRIWTIVAVFIGSIILASIVDMLTLRATLWREKESAIRQQVESGFSVLAHYHALQQKGELSAAAAQAGALDTLRAMRYGANEYFWVNELDTRSPRIVMHPIMPELEGKPLDAGQFNCATGVRTGDAGPFQPTDGRKNLFMAFADVAGRGGQGYVTYTWPAPDGVARYPKLSFVKRFGPWGWLIGSGVHMDDVERALREQAVHKALALAGSSLLLLLFASILARSITQPLHGAVSAMRVIGGGDLSGRLPAEGGSEIAELARGFNDMLAALQARDAELAQHRASLEREVARRTAELRDSNGRLEQELAERRQAEHAMRESRARMRALLDASGESVLLLDPDGKILAINSFGAARFGHTPDSIAGHDFFDLMDAELAVSRRAAVRAVVASGQPMHTRDRRGAIFFDNNLYPVEDEYGVVESIAVYAKDVSEQQHAKQVEDIFRHLDTVLLKWRVNLASIAQMFCDDILPAFDLVAAWVGRAEKDGRVTLLASAEAAGHGVLDQLRASGLRWDGAASCCAPVGAALRSGQPQLLPLEPGGALACGAAARALGAGVALLLPLTLRGVSWGVLTLYGRDPGQFSLAGLPARLEAVAGRFGVSLESASQQEWLTLLDTALAGVGNAVFITDASAAILWGNHALEQLTGYPSAELLGRTPQVFGSGVQDGAFYRHFWQTIQAGATWRGEIVNLRRDGTRYTANQTVTPLLNAAGQVSHYVAVIEDISARKADEQRMYHTANFDALTDLPNRACFFDRLGQALALARREGRRGGLLFLDLDRFKQVNDQLGHAAGDSLLIAVAQRLREQVRASDTVARLAGDEFTVILPHLDGGADAAGVADKILAAIARPFPLAGHQVSIGVSIGIALFPQDGDTVEAILNAADHAMYLAKEGGRNRHAFAAAPLCTLEEAGA